MNRAARRRLEKVQAKQGAAVLVGGSETLHRKLQLGLTHHQAGRLEQAQAYYQSILAEQPNHVEANHLLGVAFGMQGRLGEAIAQFFIHDVRRQ
ncbi:MAG: tetratricopeptide repeat protein, partial [Proteobacteria bacterium]|nr:tetratricopeptide repeat protein [Pseudomonadota bacterium]